ncbi:MAG: hypothetical protein ACLP8X_26480, partial [Streptosporangiaceae bacterium]
MQFPVAGKDPGKSPGEDPGKSHGKSPGKRHRKRHGKSSGWWAGWLFGAVTVVPAMLAAAWLLPAFPLLLAGRFSARPMVFM